MDERYYTIAEGIAGVALPQKSIAWYGYQGYGIVNVDALNKLRADHPTSTPERV